MPSLSRSTRAAPMLTALLALLVTACSSVPYAQRVSERRAHYEAVAGTPVQSFHLFHSLWSWESLSKDELVVFTQADRAWLLSVPGCTDLPFANAIALTSSFDAVRVGFDQVLTGGNSFPCFIRQIRPIDVKRLKLQREERGDGEKVARPATGAPVAAGS